MNHHKSSSRNISVILICICFILSFLVGCGDQVRSEIDSGGLGLSKKAWEAKYGSSGGGQGNISLYNVPTISWQPIRITFWAEPEQISRASRISGIRILTWFVESSGSESKETRREEIRKQVLQLLPADAKYVRTNEVMPGPYTIVDYFSSDNLKDLFPQLDTLEPPWGDELPGTIRVTYNDTLPGLNIIVGNHSAPPFPSPTMPPTPTLEPITTYDLPPVSIGTPPIPIPSVAK